MSGRTWTVEIVNTGAREHRASFTVRAGDDASGEQVIRAVRVHLREAMLRGRCAAFWVSVHSDGPDCDHERRAP